MRLYANEKEAKVLQLALAHLITIDASENEIAQTLLLRIAQCLELQDIARKADKSAKTSD